MKVFYGYKHWTLEKAPRCFNVGKGRQCRVNDLRARNHKWHAIVKRLGLRVEVCVGFKCDNHNHVFDGKCQANDDVCAWEIECIAKENSFSTNHSHDDMNDIGCNFTRGGEGTTGRKVSEKTSELQRQRRKSAWSDPDRRQHMLEGMDKPESKMKQRLGLVHALARSDVKARQSFGIQQAWKTSDMLQALRRPIVQMTIGGAIIATFGSVCDAERVTGIAVGNIALCARQLYTKRGLLRTAGGFHWEYITTGDAR